MPSAFSTPSSPARLGAALTVSGLLCAATAGGSWPFWPSALLWAVPLLVAVRCLPLLLGVVVAFAVTFFGRALAFHAALGDDVWKDAAVAAAVAVPALVADRFVVFWLPRVGNLFWPCIAVVVVWLADGTPSGPLVAPLPITLNTVAYMAQDVGVAGAVFVVAVVAQAMAAAATALNRRADVYPQAVRENGIRWAAIGTLVTMGPLFAAETIRAHVATPPASSSSTFEPGDLFANACAVAVVVLVAATAVTAVKARKKA